MKKYILIPARLESSRLPRKALKKILDLPIIIHVALRAKLCKNVEKVIVCTDSPEICWECEKYNIEVCVDNGTCPELCFVPNIALDEGTSVIAPTITPGPPAGGVSDNGCRTFIVDIPLGTGGLNIDFDTDAGALFTVNSGPIPIVAMGSASCADLNMDSVFINEIHYDRNR